MDIRKNISENIKNLLKEKNWDLKMLAQKSKVSCRTVKNIIDCKTKNLRATTMVKIVVALGVGLDYIVGRTQKNKCFF